MRNAICEEKNQLVQEVQAWLDLLAVLKISLKEIECLTASVNGSGYTKINGTELAALR